MSDARGAPTGAGSRLPGWLVTYLKGVAMGTADAVPGVSGGTIALVAGIYDRLVAAVAAFDPRPLWVAAGRRDPRPVRDLLAAMDARFLLVLGAGIATGLAGIARVVEAALATRPAPTFAFFFGVIAASAAVLAGEVSLSTRRGRAAAVGGLLLGILLVGGVRARLGHGPAVLFFAGVVSVSAMILPGVSGAFVLLVLGQYEYMAGRLNALVDAVAGLATGGTAEAVLAPAAAVGTYAAGAGLGLVAVARLVRRALERDRATTLTFLVGLMVGALRLPIEEVVAAAPSTPAALLAVLGAAAAGALLVAGLDRYTAGIGYAGRTAIE